MRNEIQRQWRTTKKRVLHKCERKVIAKSTSKERKNYSARINERCYEQREAKRTFKKENIRMEKKEKISYVLMKIEKLKTIQK